MQLDFLFNTGPKKHISKDALQVGDQLLPVRLVRNTRSKRYVLRLGNRGEIRVTIPRGGSQKEALNLAHANIPWLEKQWEKHKQPATRNRGWKHGTRILFRGEPVPLNIIEKNAVRIIQFATEEIVIDAVDEIKPAAEQHLWSMAKLELPPRVAELAMFHEFNFSRSTIRNQRTRWGSCSPGGTISLNWRLIQMPPEVSDYIILHELAHTRFLNHSKRYWTEVRRVCPGYREAEQWIKRHGEKLLPAV